MSQIEHEQPPTSLETPWGKAEIVTSDIIREYARQGAEGLSIETDVGRAQTALYLDPELNIMPEHVRLVMLSSYSSGAQRDPSDSRGASTLEIDGNVYGWRAQAFIHAETHEVSHVTISIVDANFQLVDDKAIVADLSARVQGVVDQVVEEARTADPGFVPRVYSLLMQRYETELTDTVTAIERQLEDARTHRDAVQALAGAAAERAASHEHGAAPSPRA